MAALVAGTLGTAPAHSTPGPAGIADGINITVFHNIDFVATFGWGVGDNLTIEVFRNGVLIGSAAGPTVDAGPDGGALEVNHGPAGAPEPGDCFEGHTPDVRPGDLIRVTGPTSVNEVIVDNLTFSGAATEALDGTVEVRGVAKTAAGAAIPAASLDSAEFRDPPMRGAPTEVVADPLVDGGFIMRYEPPYFMDRNRDNLNEAQRKESLLTSGGHAIGFGHTAPLPDEAMLIDGLDDAPGPALGCEGSPAARHAVTEISNAKPGYLNAADLAGGGNVTFSGVSFDADSVTLDVNGLTRTVTPTGATDQTWTATIPKADLAALPDGNLTASMTSNRTAGNIPGDVSMSLMKDATVPLAPQVTATDPVSPNPSSNPAIKGSAGATEDASMVSIYNTADCSGAPMVSGTGQAFRTTGLSTRVGDNSTTTFHARTVDLAGNPSDCSTGRTYVQDAVAPPRPALGASSTTGAVPSTDAMFEFSNAEAGVAFKCALDGATPTTCASPLSYSGLAEGTHSVSITAIDAAGNVSDPLVAPWIVDVTAPGTPAMAGTLSGRVSSRTATFAFSHGEPGVTFLCSLDGAADSSCTSPVTYRKLAQGKHSLAITAQDAAGHLSGAKIAKWTVDTKGPKVAARNPGKNAKNVRPGKNLKVTMSEKVTGVSKRSVKVFAAGSSKATKAVVSYNRRKNIIKIDPRTVLQSGTRYSIELGRGIKDLAGNRLNPKVWRFKTRG